MLRICGFFSCTDIAKLLALSELQKGNLSAAASYLSESQGMFLHSDIIDKHLNYIRYAVS